MLIVGQQVKYHHPGQGIVNATVLRDRRGGRWNLDVGGELHEFVLEGPDVGCCWSADEIPVPAEKAPELLTKALVPRPPFPAWPSIVALAVATVSLGLTILNLLR